MYRFYVPSDGYEYHYAELCRVFLPEDDFEIISIDKLPDPGFVNENSYVIGTSGSHDRDSVKRELYAVLSDITDMKPEWGTLTGVRPLKPALDILGRTGSLDDMKRSLKELYLIADSKADLLSEIAEYQTEYVRGNPSDFISVYTGIPFCPTRCEYCSFASNVADEDAIALYLENLGIGPDLRSDLRKKGKSTLRRYVEEGQEAKNKLIQCNLRLVLFVAKKYSHSKRSIEDLVQDGNMGLMTAVDRFDYTRGFKFSTYAYNWINQSITRELANQNKTIRIPVHLIERINQMHRAERALSVSLGYEPSDEEIAKKMECTVEQIRNMHAISQTIVSLDSPVGEDQDATYGDFIVDQTASKADEEAEHKDLQTKLSNVMDKALTEKEKAVLVYRFGLDGGEPMTLDEVGSIYHVTRERIRQIEAKALRKMRSPKYAKFLNDFRDDPHKKVEYNRYAW